MSSEVSKLVAEYVNFKAAAITAVAETDMPDIIEALQASQPSKMTDEINSIIGVYVGELHDAGNRRGDVVNHDPAVEEWYAGRVVALLALRRQWGKLIHSAQKFFGPKLSFTEIMVELSKPY